MLNRVIYYLRKSFVISLFIAGVAIFLLGPVAIVIYTQEPFLIFSYLVSWIPSVFFFTIADAISQIESN